MTENVFELREVTLVFSPIKRLSLISGGWATSKHVKTSPIKALDGINLTIEKGKKIGIIGRNGAGKTTLMRLLAGIYEQSSGEMIVNSHSVALLALGVGFDPNSSGIENIYLGSMLMGMTKKRIDGIVDDIVAFSELGDKIYNPIKTYSTGMKARLGFSIAIFCDPEVLLLDEVLSVGDFEFQKKSRQKMDELMSSGNKTVVISSHSMDTIRDICDEAIWLDAGKVKGKGPPRDVIKQYLDSKRI